MTQAEQDFERRIMSDRFDGLGHRLLTIEGHLDERMCELEKRFERLDQERGADCGLTDGSMGQPFPGIAFAPEPTIDLPCPICDRGTKFPTGEECRTCGNEGWIKVNKSTDLHLLFMGQVTHR